MVGTGPKGTGLVLQGTPWQAAAGQPGVNRAALQYDGAALRGVWGTGPGDVWLAEYRGAIQRWGGTSWRSGTAPATGLLGLGGTGASGRWAVGLSGALVHGDG